VYMLAKVTAAALRFVEQTLSRANPWVPDFHLHLNYPLLKTALNYENPSSS
jgi:hypothetical protein